MDKFYPTFVARLPEEDGPGFIAHVPDLTGCMSHGDTPEEALVNVRQAALEWIEEATELGRPIPEPNSFAAAAKANRERLQETLESQRKTIETELATLKKALTDLTKRILDRLDEQPEWGSHFTLIAASATRRTTREEIQH